MEPGFPLRRGIMRHLWKVFETVAILGTLFIVSCSPPGQDLRSARASQPVADKAPDSNSTQLQVVEPPKTPRTAAPVEEVKKTRREVVPSTATRPPAPSSAAAP